MQFRLVAGIAATCEPHAKQWFDRYQRDGLELIAVHSPEFERERAIVVAEIVDGLNETTAVLSKTIGKLAHASAELAEESEPLVTDRWHR